MQPRQGSCFPLSTHFKVESEGFEPSMQIFSARTSTPPQLHFCLQYYDMCLATPPTLYTSRLDIKKALLQRFWGTNQQRALNVFSITATPNSNTVKQSQQNNWMLLRFFRFISVVSILEHTGYLSFLIGNSFATTT